NVPEISDVEQTVMGWAVIAAQPGAIHAKANVQFLNRHVVDRHVVSALKKGGVNRKERSHPLRRQPAGKQGRMFLRDSDVEITVRMRFLKMPKTGSARHRRRDRDQLLIVIGKLSQRFANDLRIGWRRCRRGLAALDLVFAEAVEFIRLLDRRFVTLALFRQDMEQHRLLLRFKKFEGAGKQRNIVSVDGPVIAETEFLKNDARQNKAFHALFDFVREL